MVERKHRHLLEVTRALIFTYNTPKFLLGEAILTATFLINHLHSSRLNWKSPHELFYGNKPDLTSLRIFSCRDFDVDNTPHKDKLAPRSIAGIFVGYPSVQKGYKIYCPSTRRIFIARHVIFREHVFLFHAVGSSLSSTFPDSSWPAAACDELDISIPVLAPDLVAPFSSKTLVAPLSPFDVSYSSSLAAPAIPETIVRRSDCSRRGG